MRGLLLNWLVKHCPLLLEKKMVNGEGLSFSLGYYLIWISINSCFDFHLSMIKVSPRLKLMLKMTEWCKKYRDL